MGTGVDQRATAAGKRTGGEQDERAGLRFLNATEREGRHEPLRKSVRSRRGKRGRRCRLPREEEGIKATLPDGTAAAGLSVSSPSVGGVGGSERWRRSDWVGTMGFGIAGLLLSVRARGSGPGLVWWLPDSPPLSFLAPCSYPIGDTMPIRGTTSSVYTEGGHAAVPRNQSISRDLIRSGDDSRSDARTHLHCCCLRMFSLAHGDR